MTLRISILLAVLCISSAVFARDPIIKKWTVGADEREALIYLPPTSSAAKAPVVFAFHGRGDNMRFAARGMHFQDAWSEAIVVYMQGLPIPGKLGDEKGVRPGWQHDPGELGNRDLKFFDAVLATVREKYSIDDRRIYATGFSNGGFFTYSLWVERPDAFAAFAPGAATILPSLRLTRPLPALHFGGRRDWLVKFKDQEKTIESVRKLDGCSARGEPCGMNCTLYPSATGTRLATFIHLAGHIYPPPATALIVKFFQEHPRGS
jgi:polyhydroxybutyrate depolymerase